MLFNSFQFIIFFIIVVFFYYIIPHKKSWVLLLISSLFFYMSWNPVLIILILFSTLLNFLISLKIHNIENKKHRKYYLITSCIINFGLLFVFKYLVFINHSLIKLFEVLPGNYPFSEFNIILPMGISFYTFQASSYTIDVYKGRIKPERNFFMFTLFITFFPQLVAGPIERSESLLPQLAVRKKFQLDNIIEGSKYLITGYFKKVVIADRAAIIVNNIYNYSTGYTGIYFCIATILFAFQIYCDFSGYSEIALGCAKILGIDLMINFDRPYMSKSIREFWKRWHVSLSTWFKDYLYIPMGGNRKGKARQYFNIFITFLISGLWHGANWTFVFWGALHGVYQIIGDITSKQQKKLKRLLKIDKINISTIITIALVFFAWIFFRANSISDALYIIKNLWSDISLWTNLSYLYSVARNLGVTLFELIILAVSITLLIITELPKNSFHETLKTKNIILHGGFYYILIILIFSWGVFSNASQFIYFQF